MINNLAHSNLHYYLTQTRNTIDYILNNYYDNVNSTTHYSQNNFNTRQDFRNSQSHIDNLLSSLNTYQRLQRMNSSNTPYRSSIPVSSSYIPSSTRNYNSNIYDNALDTSVTRENGSANTNNTNTTNNTANTTNINSRSYTSWSSYNPTTYSNTTSSPENLNNLTNTNETNTNETNTNETNTNETNINNSTTASNLEYTIPSLNTTTVLPSFNSFRTSEQTDSIRNIENNIRQRIRQVLPELVEITLYSQSSSDTSPRDLNFTGTGEDQLVDVPVPTDLHSLRENSTVDLYQNIESDYDTCCICRERLRNTDIIRRFNSCNHIFHMNCIDTWLESHTVCPVCRSDIRDNENDNENENENSSDNMSLPSHTEPV